MPCPLSNEAENGERPGTSNGVALDTDMTSPLFSSILRFRTSAPEMTGAGPHDVPGPQHPPVTLGVPMEKLFHSSKGFAFAVD